MKKLSDCAKNFALYFFIFSPSVLDTLVDVSISEIWQLHKYQYVKPYLGRWVQRRFKAPHGPFCRESEMR